MINYEELLSFAIYATKESEHHTWMNKKIAEWNEQNDRSWRMAAAQLGMIIHDYIPQNYVVDD